MKIERVCIRRGGDVVTNMEGEYLKAVFSDCLCAGRPASWHLTADNGVVYSIDIYPKAKKKKKSPC